MTVNTKNDIEQSCIGLSAMVTFIGLYLGIIFLISSAAILALKELSESTDNRERYVMLRKLGADEKMLNKALFKQIGLFFGFPLFIIIHSIVGIKILQYNTSINWPNRTVTINNNDRCISCGNIWRILL